MNHVTCQSQTDRSDKASVCIPEAGLEINHPVIVIEFNVADKQQREGKEKVQTLQYSMTKPGS